MAASAGQFLLSAGTPGKRFALPHARILLHQGSAGIGGTAVDIEIQADDLRHTRDTVLGLIAEHTGQPIAAVGEGLPARPLVHRRAGPRVRVRRSGGGRAVDDVRPARRPSDGRPAMSATRSPTSSSIDGPRRAHRRRLLAAAGRPDHLPGHRDRRRRGQRADRAAAAPGVRGRVLADQPVHQLPGRSISAMLAVYDAMQYVTAPVRHDLRRPGAWPAPRCCWPGRAGQPGDPAARAGGAAPAGGAGQGHHPRPDPGGRGDRPGAPLLEEILAADTGHTAEKVRTDTERDLVLTAEQARDYGIVDVVIDTRGAQTG